MHNLFLELRPGESTNSLFVEKWRENVWKNDDWNEHERLFPLQQLPQRGQSLSEQHRLVTTIWPFLTNNLRPLSNEIQESASQVYKAASRGRSLDFSDKNKAVEDCFILLGQAEIKHIIDYIISHLETKKGEEHTTLQSTLEEFRSTYQLHTSVYGSTLTRD